MVVVSKNNPLVKELASLKEKKFRKERGTFLAEGEKMVRECFESGLSVVRLAVREDYRKERYADCGCPVFVFGSEAFSAICDEKTPQGIAAEVQIPSAPLVPPEGNCLLLDGVSDPANLGAIVRTANAAGFSDIYAVGCTDPYAPKCVRASMSGIFYVRFMRGAIGETLAVLEGVPIIAADMKGENVFHFTPPGRYALAIGNEGRGLCEEILRRAEYTVKIPMGAHTESLNAAVSAGIMMYLLNKKVFE